MTAPLCARARNGCCGPGLPAAAMSRCDCSASAPAICRPSGSRTSSPPVRRGSRGSTPPSTVFATASARGCSRARACCRAPPTAPVRAAAELGIIATAMYTSFFGLIEKPFAITPDPRYLYLSERHAEALAHLLYGINEAGGFIQLTGEVGTGKTTIVRTLLSRVPHHADVAVILNPRVTPVEFLLTICEELGLGLDEADRTSAKEMVDALNRRLLAAHSDGRRVIVIVDEAQNLSADVLEQVRLLTNLETPTQKLLQIILIGQPELRELLDRSELRQLAQRITGRYHLNPLLKHETLQYVRHRLRVAGAPGEIFTPAALREVYRLSSGIPRVVNVCCDRALLGAYTLERREVTPALVRRAASEVYGRRFAPRWLGWVAGAITLAGVAVMVYDGITGWHSPLGFRPGAKKPA